MKRILIVLTGVVLFTALLGSVKAWADGPFHICNHNGNNYCLGDDNGINVGDQVTQQPSGEARSIDTTFIDNNCSGNCFREYLTFGVNGDYVATNTACTGLIYVKDPSATTGIVWIDYPQSDGTDIYYNQHCPGPSGLWVLGGNNTNDGAWQMLIPTSGFYWKMDLLNA